ncbi:hypothetical protein [Bradyrhizobium sp. SZCCHNR2028]|uniref:hypothetical protein n=1 Tax=Bradyrhizobium sp. SZCCHNR2028 TaxID=3057382 RepID=UPI0028EBCC05|nr:hypothetical protein [Bradyrhizobium sp. SZCCHNR2028]
MATDNSELEGLRILVAEDEGLIALELKIVTTSGHDDATLFPPDIRGLPRLAKPFDKPFDKRALRAMCEATFVRHQRNS